MIQEMSVFAGVHEKMQDEVQLVREMPMATCMPY